MNNNKKYRPPATGGRLGAKLEQKLANMARNSTFLHKILSFFFMPLAFKLGMRTYHSADIFYVEVPHNRYNRNFYGTVAGGALLANLELAAGSYLMMRSNSAYRLVCRSVNYSFKLPSQNGMHFIFESLDEDLDNLMSTNKPFNATVRVIAHALGKKPGEPGRRIGRGTVSFHLWPIPGLLS